MEKCNKYLKKLKKLYSNFDSLKDEPFIIFSIEAVDLLNKIKMAIENNYMKESNETFIKYSNLIKDKLDGLSYDRTKGLIIEIEKWLLKYNYHYNYESYSIETILSLDSESGIYNDLSYPVNRLQTDSSDDGIFELQNDFLNFCKAAIIKDILSLIENKCLLIKEVNEKSEAFKNISIQTINDVDLSDLNEKGKIIMLEELGVLNFLKEMEPFKFSTNVLSIVISGFTGIKKGTVQSYLNPMFSQRIIQKNNPMNNKKAVKKVKDRLANLGFKQSK